MQGGGSAIEGQKKSAAFAVSTFGPKQFHPVRREREDNQASLSQNKVEEQLARQKNEMGWEDRETESHEFSLRKKRIGDTAGDCA